jgi:hypothetical protein
MTVQPDKTTQQDIRQRLRDSLQHLEHHLPGQAPIKDFVHHNTLHGFQHLPFTEALAMAEKVTGAHGYLPQEQFRAFYRSGRIEQQDLVHALAHTQGLEPRKTLFEGISQQDLLIAGLLHPLKKVTGCQLNWQIEEMKALNRFQTDVVQSSRRRLLEKAAEEGNPGESDAIADLWQACLEGLGLSFNLMHPEELMDLSPEQVELIMNNLTESEEVTGRSHITIRREASKGLDRLLGQVGPELTLRGLLLHLTGQDLLDQIRPLMIRYLANHPDQGLAAWHAPDRDQGFYARWMPTAPNDLTGPYP